MAVCLVSAILSVITLAHPARAIAAPIDFDQQVKPVLEKHCLECHGPAKQESSFRIDVRRMFLEGGDLGEPLVVPGNSSKSPLLAIVSGRGDLKMPPEGDPLGAADVEILKRWIDDGLKMPAGSEEVREALKTDHWSFQPLASVAAPVDPDAQTRTWTANPIDAFVRRRQREMGLIASPVAEPEVLIRRLFLVMHGLAPTRSQVAEFARDPSAAAYDRLVDHVLASPRYGERWARHWLDVVRFGETHGFETNRERPNAYHYRDYVIAAFNDDRPYDEFVREQIAGDAFGRDVATGFLVAGPYDLVKSPDINLTLMQRQDELADMVNTTGVTFLGLTLGCARCHHHKFDPITQSDYYALQAVYAGVEHGDRAMSLGSQRAASVARTRRRIDDLRRRLQAFIPAAQQHEFVIVDDKQLVVGGRRGVRHLLPKAGEGVNPPGSERGFRDDRGGSDRIANLSGGGYSWWKVKPGEFAISYHPRVRGEHRVWLSWGAGIKTHTQAAEYVLDMDGDLATPADQRVIATVDQQKFARNEGQLTGQPLWSGLQNAGLHRLLPSSIVALRTTSGEALTADAVVFEPATATAEPEPARIGFREPVNPRRNIEVISGPKVRRVRFTVFASNSSQPCVDELELWSGDRNVALATNGGKPTSSSNLPGHEIHKLEHINDGRYGNGRSWISNETGKGWVEIELPQFVSIDRIEWGRDREGRYSDRLATNYRIEGENEAGQLVVLAASGDRMPLTAGESPPPTYRFDGLSAQRAAEGRRWMESLRAAESELVGLLQSTNVYAGKFTTPPVVHRLYRGEPLAKREVVEPDALGVISSLNLPPDASEQLRRRRLAEWLVTDARHLTARVIVNRVWYYQFGRGIVDTPSDFGANGVRPTHPELLDWLAAELIRRDWSVKEIHRLILTSSTFRQTSRPREEALAKDADCRLLWRFPPRRLEAEAIRDCTVQAAGVLDLRMGGPGFSAFEVDRENVRHYFPKTMYGPGDWRRMVYMTKVRQEQDSVFGAFDCPDASQVMPKRSRSTTPLQAFNLFNSRFMLQQAEILADRLERDVGGDVKEQIQLAFELCFSRRADQEELAGAMELRQDHGLIAITRALLNSNEFLFIQ